MQTQKNNKKQQKSKKGYKLNKNSQWLKDINDWKREWEKEADKLRHSEISPIHYARLCHDASEIINEIDPEASVIFDTGNIMCFAPAFFDSFSRNVTTNNTQFARMGWSCPGIIGAKLANPNHPAIAFLGDGSFMMTCTAIATAVEYSIPAVWVVLNNKTLQIERYGMNYYYGRESFCKYQKEKTGELWNHDFVKVAEGLGASAVRVEKPSEIKKAIKEAINSNVPFVIDLETDNTQKRHVIQKISGLENYETLPFPWTFGDKALVKNPI
jgi:acetolactate synthase-1/2/3 large subunit